MVLPLFLNMAGLPDWVSLTLGPPLVCLTIAFVALHGKLTLGGRRTAGLVVIVAAAGFAAEYASLHWGTIFGSRYSYPPDRWPGGSVCCVPLLVALFWAVYVYIGYAVVDSFMRWLGVGKPAHDSGRAADILILPLLVAADGIVVTAIDLFTDPVLVFRGNWVWEEAGVFFGVPLGNFTGWFLVVVAATGLFRTLEFFRPAPAPAAPDALHLMPVVIYGLLAFGFAVYSLRIMDRPALTVVGTLAMGAVVVANAVCYAFRKRLAS